MPSEIQNVLVDRKEARKLLTGLKVNGNLPRVNRTLHISFPGMPGTQSLVIITNLDILGDKRFLVTVKYGL